jgi:hypothetical protein
VIFSKAASFAIEDPRRGGEYFALKPAGAPLFKPFDVASNDKGRDIEIGSEMAGTRFIANKKCGFIEEFSKVVKRVEKRNSVRGDRYPFFSLFRA